MSKAVFYFRRDVKSSQEDFIYSSTSMLAEIGGYVGLLGLNLIDQDFMICDILKFKEYLTI